MLLIFTRSVVHHHHYFLFQLEAERGERYKLEQAIKTGSLPDDTKVGFSNAASALSQRYNITTKQPQTLGSTHTPLVSSVGGTYSSPPPPPPPLPNEVAPPPPPPPPGSAGGKFDVEVLCIQ